MAARALTLALSAQADTGVTPSALAYSYRAARVCVPLTFTTSFDSLLCPSWERGNQSKETMGMSLGMRSSGSSAFALALPFLFALGTACSSVPAAPLQAGQQVAEVRAADVVIPEGLISLVLGGRTVDDANDLDLDSNGAPDTDLGDQGAVGAEVSTMMGSGLGLEAALSYSLGDDTFHGAQDVDLELSVLEFSLGLRYTLTKLGRFLPYVGGGASYLSWRLSADPNPGLSDNDGDVGLYVHGGVNYLLGNHYALGFDARGLFGTSDDLDYTQGALVISYAP